LGRMNVSDRAKVVDAWIRSCVTVLDGSPDPESVQACWETLRTMATVQSVYETCVRDLFRDQVDNDLVLDASTWGVLVDVLAAEGRRRLVQDLMEALEGDQAEVRRSLPALSALVGLDQKLLPREQLFAVLEKWVREIQDRGMSELLATELSGSSVLAASARKALGSRPAKTAPEREVWDAVFAVLSSGARKAG